MPAVTTIVGNLVRDPESKEFGPDKNVTNIRVACTDRMPDGKGGWKDGDTAFYNVSAWRSLGKYMASSLKKGDKVIVQGKIKYHEFKKSDGTNGHAYEIEASDVGLALYSKTAKKDASSNPWDTSSNTTTVNTSNEPDPWL
jgi:single-strand DNA-binding protein